MLPREYLSASKRGHCLIRRTRTSIREDICQSHGDSSIRVGQRAGSEWYKSGYNEFLVSGGSAMYNIQQKLCLGSWF